MLSSESELSFPLQMYCQACGANLASIHNPMEHEFIQELVKNETHAYTRAWIGGTDAVNVHY